MTDQVKLTIPEHSELLTGYDEEKILARFGHPVYRTVDHEPLIGMGFYRSLVFAAGRRDGLDDDAAYKRAMSMSTKDVNDFFAEDQGDEIDPEEPDTDAGKDVSLDG